jgi:multidrug efflux pump
MAFVFLLAVLVSYFVLAAQFESFVSPFVVMLTVPLGAFGAVVALKVVGYTMNIYTQIGLIMLIGLSAKHGILIVEFANQLREEGIKFEEALLRAAKLRLRPIIMTGISTVMGAVPLMLAVGAGAAGRRNLGIVQVFGGISGILLTLAVIPVGYLIFCRRAGPVDVIGNAS